MLAWEKPDVTTSYDEIYKNWDSFPDCRIRVDIGGDGGENMWGKELPGGLYGINNDPLHLEYRWQDIVSRREIRDDKAVVHRRWKTKTHFTFDDPKDKEQSKALREKMLAAFKATARTALGFWAPGVCYAHFEDRLTMPGALLTGVCVLSLHESNVEE